MIKLYQVAGVMLNAQLQPFHGNSYDSNNDAMSLAWSNETVWKNKMVVPSTRQLSITAELADTGWPIETLYQRLSAIVGKPTDIIGYVTFDEQGLDELLYGDKRQRIIWLQNTGIVKGISPAGKTTINLSLEISLYWTPLDRYLWRWQPGYASELTVHPRTLPYCEGMCVPPDLVQISFGVGKGHSFTKKRYDDYSFMYDPQYWCATVDGYDMYHPSVGVAHTWHESELTAIFSDSGIWGAPHKSIYAFTNLPTSGEIVVSVTSESLPFQTASEDSVIDLSELNIYMDAAGHGGLLPTDIVYAGLISAKPSCVKRNGVMLSNVRGKALHSNDFFGLVNAGDSLVNVTMPSGALYAYLHLHRRV